MPRQLHMTYLMLCPNGCTPPSAPQPPPQPQPPQPDDEFDVNSAEAAEEVTQWDEQQQVPGVPEQTAILASFSVQRLRRLKEEQREFINDANFEHAIEISRQGPATEEAGRLLMATERQKILEHNAQRQAEAAARKQARLAQNEASRQWLASLRGQCRRQAPATSAAMLHHQMREARVERRALMEATKGKNGDEAGPPRAPADDQQIRVRSSLNFQKFK
nr:uncharacterized protein LOC127347514 [Lolium perenne]